ncbi:MAG: DNA-3-methyladenine glycosylase I [Pelagimonas sp.]|jgi:3-methyladenine DNA glycosylase Tag|nr:DNA-3-methyladenine glycosylase I [Pelagimonas sp.]
MRTFADILEIAAERKGSREAALADMPEVKSAEEIAQIPEDRWLAAMARGIFQTGISWQVVDRKWPDIEEAFYGFDVGRVAMMSDDWFYDLIEDKRIIRAPAKVRAIQENAVFIQSVEGGFAQRVAQWPASDFVGLVLWLKKEGARLGGNTGAYMLRQMGKESYYMGGDVVARLVAEGVIDKAPTSQKAWKAVQAAFNTWAEESGESLTVISRVLARSV